MPEQIKRHVAYKVRIKDLLEAPYTKGEGDWDPNFIQLNNKQISRVNLVGVVVSKQNETDYNSIMLDDSSGRISIRFFGNNLPADDLNVIDLLQVIGRPREFGNERYIVPEIIKKIDNKKWMEVRNLELKDKKLIIKKHDTTEKEITQSNDPTTKIIELIRQSDSGDGADTQQIISSSNIDNMESIIKNLLETGEIFEIKPGRLKVLE